MIVCRLLVDLNANERRFNAAAAAAIMAQNASSEAGAGEKHYGM